MKVKHGRRLAALMVGAAGLLGVAQVQAGPILGSAVSAATDSGGVLAIANITNQSGLSAGYTSGATDFDPYVAGATHSSLGGTNSGFTATAGTAPPGQFFTFDLGAISSIDALAFWEVQNPGSVTRFDLFADSDANPGNGVGALLGNFTANQLLDPVSDPAQIFNFAATNTQFVQLQALNTVGGTTTTPGIGEIAFRSTAAAVPEPSTLAIFGLGLLGLALRRRVG